MKKQPQLLGVWMAKLAYDCNLLGALGITVSAEPLLTCVF